MDCRKISLLLCLFFIVVGCRKKECEETIEEEYVYPIEASLGKTFEERIEIFKIPDQVLLCISTKALVKSCTNHPLMIYMWSVSDLQGGFDKVVSMCNGFEELWHRGDRYNELMHLYKQKNFEHDWKPEPNVEDGRYMDDIVRVELILAQYEILKGLSKAEKIELFQQVLDNQKKKYSLKQYWGNTGMQTTCAILSRIMFLDKYAAFIQEYNSNEFMFILTSYVLILDSDVVNKVMDLSDEYLNTLKSQ